MKVTGQRSREETLDPSVVVNAALIKRLIGEQERIGAPVNHRRRWFRRKRLQTQRNYSKNQVRSWRRGAGRNNRDEGKEG